ncbi:M48 family metalloprotease [Pseudovibrio sp. Ad37]|uniref:M48 family metalloprotease n=1 Tax=Pseudovibrio sp. Ad37 TaxID=989422 RepID=UPI0007AECFCF|nr:M48 family metalloprotease [Pseudovibrio sp. Ad37]KZL24252.1 hypothetical protein PsAD37_02823 [Pseudovibrio sp. Ad37]
MLKLFRALIIEIVALLTLGLYLIGSAMLIALVLQLVRRLLSLFYANVPQITDLHAFGISALVTVFWAMVAHVIPGLIETLTDIEVGARKPSEREKKQLADALELVQLQATTANVALPRIVLRVIDQTGENAVAYTRNRVAVTSGLLITTQTRDNGLLELGSVIAHEMGHLRHWDTRWQMLSRLLMAPYNFLIKVIIRMLGPIPLVGPVSILILMALSVPVRIANSLLPLTSRLQEFRADEFAFRLVGPSGIASLFDSMYRRENVAGSGLFAYWVRSHPPIELRRDRLLKLADKVSNSTVVHSAERA